MAIHEIDMFPLSLLQQTIKAPANSAIDDNVRVVYRTSDQVVDHSVDSCAWTVDLVRRSAA